MIPERLFEISDEKVLYHYCSPDAFTSIIKNKTIRLSDITMMNDAEEGKWGYNIWLEVANRLLAPGPQRCLPEPVNLEFIDEIDGFWTASGVAMSSFIAAFSKDSDSLSQWRAYADDGRGYAIGFRSSALRRLPIQLLEVCYDFDQQIREMLITVSAIFLEWLDKGRDFNQPWFRERCLSLAMSSIAFKNPAWRDEHEVRCQHVVSVDISDAGWLLRDDGGESEGQTVPGVPIEFHVRNGSIVPFIDLPFDPARDPIAEIVMGPKCPNGPGNVLFLLGNNGLGQIPLRSAGAAYR